MAKLVLDPIALTPLAVLGEGACRRRVGELIRSHHLRAGIAVIDVGKRAPLHSHPLADEVNLILQGRGALVCSGKRLEFQEGSFIYVPAGEEHQHLNDGSSPLWLFWLYAPATRLPGED